MSIRRIPEYNSSDMCELCSNNQGSLNTRWVEHKIAKGNQLIIQLFHHKCLMQAIKKNKGCPICERHIQEKNQVGST